MASDLKVDIDGVRLNIRVGLIMKYGNEVAIEISTVGRNSVIPGGRMKINENSRDALSREINEEMNLNLDKQKLSMIKVFENFFTYEQKDFHEIYFLYEYPLNKNEYDFIKNNVTNKDNSTTFFKFVKSNELEKYNLLPLDLHEIIKNCTNKEKEM